MYMYVCMHSYIYMYVCMYVCMYACMYACMYVCILIFILYMLPCKQTPKIFRSISGFLKQFDVSLPIFFDNQPKNNCTIHFKFIYSNHQAPSFNTKVDLEVNEKH